MAPLADGAAYRPSRFRVAIHVVIILSRWRALDRRRKSSNLNARLGRRLEGKVSTQEEKMIGMVLTSRGLLSKSTEAMELISEAVDSDASLDLVFSWMHRMKYFACRSLWSTVIEPLQRDLDRQKESVQELKSKLAEARVNYLKEISLLRDRGRTRTDPDVVLPGEDWSSFWTPEDAMTPEEQNFFADALKEKVKMLLDANPKASQKIDFAQLEALNRGIARNQQDSFTRQVSSEKEMVERQLEEARLEIQILTEQVEQQNPGVAGVRQNVGEPAANSFRRPPVGAPGRSGAFHRNQNSKLYLELEAERSQNSKLQEQVDALGRSEEQLQQELESKEKQVELLFGKLNRNKTQNESMYAEIGELNRRLQDQAAHSRRESEERQAQLDEREREVEHLQAAISELQTQAEIRKQWLVAHRRNSRRDLFNQSLPHSPAKMCDHSDAESPARPTTQPAHSLTADTDSDAESPARPTTQPPHSKAAATDLHAESPARSITAAVKLYMSYNFMRYFRSELTSLSPDRAAAVSVQLERSSDCRPSGYVQLEKSSSTAPTSSVDMLLERCVHLEEQLQLESECRTHWESHCHMLENLEGRPKTSEIDQEEQLRRRKILEEEIQLLQQQRSGLLQQCQLLKIAAEGGVTSYNELQKVAMEVITKEKDDLSARCTRLGDQLQQEEASRVHWEGQCKRLQALVENKEEDLQLAEDVRARRERECERLQAVMRSESPKTRIAETSTKREPQTKLEIAASAASMHRDDLKEQLCRLKDRLKLERGAREELEHKFRHMEASLHSESGGTGEAVHAGDMLERCTSLEDQLRQEKENSACWQQKYHELIKEAALNSGSKPDSLLSAESSRPAEVQTIATYAELQVEASFCRKPAESGVLDPPPSIEVLRQNDAQVGELTDAIAGADVQEKSNSCAVPEGLCEEAQLPLMPGLGDCSVAGHSCSYKKELEAALLLIAEISAQLAVKVDAEAALEAKVQQSSTAMSNENVDEGQAAQTCHQLSVQPPQSQRVQRPRPQPGRIGSKDSSRVLNASKVASTGVEPPVPPSFSAVPLRSPRHSSSSTLTEPPPPRSPSENRLPPVNLSGTGQEAQVARKGSKCSTHSQMRIFLPTIDLEESGVALLPISSTSRSNSKTSPRRSCAEIMPASVTSRSDSKVSPKSVEPSPLSSPGRRSSEMSASSGPRTEKGEVPLAVVEPQGRKLRT
eukprot:TRINITY_DN92575_c0_g1_i1.p1 TRINITY_DN92575_c0_g1~~TRINITY_DN92575_c0_g1_i1.p1  ORF type:complete len:1206 (-),score=227.31 TRINITY_DN92575_c0_g1_i1:13-3630(-)